MQCCPDLGDEEIAEKACRQGTLSGDQHLREAWKPFSNTLVHEHPSRESVISSSTDFGRQARFPRQREGITRMHKLVMAFFYYHQGTK